MYNLPYLYWTLWIMHVEDVLLTSMISPGSEMGPRGATTHDSKHDVCACTPDTAVQTRIKKKDEKDFIMRLVPLSTDQLLINSFGDIWNHCPYSWLSVIVLGAGDFLFWWR